MSAYCVPGTNENTSQILMSLILTRTPTQIAREDQAKTQRGLQSHPRPQSWKKWWRRGFKSRQPDYKVDTFKHCVK